MKFGRSKTETMTESVINAAELAWKLAQDTKFRKRLFSGVEHGSVAAGRARRGLGLGGAVTRLAAAETLLRELRDARDDLQRAYGRLQAKRRSHKLRNFTLLAALASLVGSARVRAGIAAAFARAANQRRPLVGPASHPSPANSNDSAQPRSLEDLTKEELYARAQEADIPGRSEMSKEQLVEALRTRR